MGRAPCCSTKKGPWTTDEDEKLKAFITLNGIGNWQRVPEKCGIARCGKSCRLRWHNYLRPDIKRGPFTSSEEQKITQLHALVGNRWAFIASHLRMRTGNEIQNYWNTVLKKRQDNQSPSADHRLLKKGADVRAKAKVALGETTASSTTPSSSMKSRRGRQSTHVASAHCVRSHLAEWETVTLEAEARLLREAKITTPKLAARPPSAVTADATIGSTLTLTAKFSADLCHRPAAGAVPPIRPQHRNATQLTVHQHLASPTQILSDPTVNVPPLLNRVARHELEPLSFIHKPTYVDETGALLDIISPPSSGSLPQTGQLADDHCISPLLVEEDLLFGQTLLSAARDDWSSADCDQLQLSSISQTSLAGENYHTPGSHLLTLSSAQIEEVLGSSMCNNLMIHEPYDIDESDSAFQTSVAADCCFQQVNNAA